MLGFLEFLSFIRSNTFLIITSIILYLFQIIILNIQFDKTMKKVQQVLQGHFNLQDQIKFSREKNFLIFSRTSELVLFSLHDVQKWSLKKRNKLTTARA